MITTTKKRKGGTNNLNVTQLIKYKVVDNYPNDY
jgi:hypothetical protein